MIIGRLDDCEKRLLLLPQHFIRFQKQIFITDAPYVNFGCFIIFLLIEMQTVDIIIQQTRGYSPSWRFPR